MPPATRIKNPLPGGGEGYVCVREGCNKSFGTVAHVRRHEKSHVEIPPFACTRCSKRFARSDVLARHMIAVHTRGESSALRPKSPTLELPPEVRPNTGSDPPIRPGFTPRPTSYALQPSTNSLYSVTNLLNAQSSIPDLGPNPPRPSTAFGSGTSPLTSPLPLPQQSLSSRVTSDDRALGPPNPHPFLTSARSSPAPWTAFDDVFGWGIGPEMDASLGSSGYGASTTDALNAAWLLCNNGDMSNGFTSFQFQPGPDEGRPTPLVDAPNEVSRRDPTLRGEDPWPDVFKPKSADTPLTLISPSVTTRPPPLFNYDVPYVSSVSRNAMLSLVHLAHQPHWSIANINDFPSAETLSSCVNLYIHHFHPTFPVLRPSVLRDDGAPPVLLLAAAAIGATYSKDDLKPLAIGMNELVRRILTWMRASDQRSKFDRIAVQAMLLQAMFAWCCGSRELYLHAEIMRCSLVTAARRLHLLRPSVNANTATGLSLIVEERHHNYIEEEEKRRLGWGIYLFDAQLAVLLNIPCLFAVSELGGAALPGDEEAWAATRASTWAAIVDERAGRQSSTDSPVFLNVLGSLLSNKRLSRPLNDFGSCLVAHTLYRLCLDAYSLNRALTNELTDALSSSALLLCFPPVLQVKPQALLDRLAGSWYTNQANPSSLLVSTAALSHHGHIQFTRPGFLENIKLAAGKHEPDPRRQAAIEWLRHWSFREPLEARAIVVRAGLLNALLTRFTFDTPSEILWTLDCALALWGIKKFGPDLCQESYSAVTERQTIKWSDEPDGIRWVELGGLVSFQGLGSWSEKSVADILTFFITKLEGVPWGLSKLYVQVLERLLDEEMDADKVF